MWLTKETVEEEREGLLAAKSIAVQAPAAHEEHEATRLSTEDAAAEAAASATAVLDRQAAETSRSKTSAEALHKGKRESDEVLDNLLKIVEGLSRAGPQHRHAGGEPGFGRVGGFATSARRW